MGPTSPAPLAAGASAGKALGQVAHGQALLDPPARRNRREGVKDEAASLELGMRDGQAPRTEAATAPQHEIEVEHAWAPATAAAAPEVPFDGFDLVEHGRRLKRTFHQRHGIGEVAPGGAVGGI